MFYAGDILYIDDCLNQSQLSFAITIINMTVTNCKWLPIRGVQKNHIFEFELAGKLNPFLYSTGSPM